MTCMFDKYTFLFVFIRLCKLDISDKFMYTIQAIIAGIDNI